jgi:hypothetical protein
MMDDFLTLSAELTGFTEFDLLGSGQAESYLATVIGVAGPEMVDDLLATYRNEVTETEDEQIRAGQLDLAVLSDGRFGPLARNLLKLWYAGIWFELPLEWVAAYRPGHPNLKFTPSAQAYAESLLWVTIGANPPGARAPGYGSWAGPPRIPDVPTSSIPRSLTR